MSRSLVQLVLLIGLIALPSWVEGKHFRWSSQGDALTLDPHSAAEGFNIAITGLVYERLVERGKDMKLGPVLSESWSNPEPSKWIFKLRRGVKWQDGSAFTAEDVVFSFNRARASTTAYKVIATQAGIPRKIDDFTVEFTTPQPNPAMLETIANIYIMNRSWCEKNKVARPLDFSKKEETFATRNAMGTGPYHLISWEQGVKLTHRKNRDWWGIKAGRYEGNVETIEYRPVQNASTRMAALRSGQFDFVLDPPLQDIPSLRADKDIRVWEGPEIRFIYLGFDQARDELLYADVKGKNPFKDRRVRLAAYKAIDVNALKTAVMRGLSQPTAIALPDPAGAGVPSNLVVRHPYDVARARQLLKEAGYPNGFGFKLNCPNDRFVNDEKLCVAIAGMWAKVGLNVKVESMSKTNLMPKMLNRDISAFLSGWGGGSSDAIFMLKPMLHSRNSDGAGELNIGEVKNAALDELIDKLEGEMNPVERQKMINSAVKLIHDEVFVIPLHTQVIPWASQKNISVVHRANNVLGLIWVKVN